MLREGLVQGEDDDLLNALADVEASLSKAKYLLKATSVPGDVGVILATLKPIMTEQSAWARVVEKNLAPSGQPGQTAS